jgi:hypothetical protein
MAVECQEAVISARVWARRGEVVESRQLERAQPRCAVVLTTLPQPGVGVVSASAAMTRSRISSG